jgi:putative flippase GtrA
MSDTEPNKGFVARLDNTKFALGHPELWKFIKALCVGGMSALPEMIVYMLLCSLFTKLAVSYLPDFFFFDLIVRNLEETQYLPAVQVYAFFISTAVGQAVGFILARKVAFHANSNVALSTFFKVLVVLFTIGANGVIGPGLVGLLARVAFLAKYPSLVQLISKLASMAATMAWGYPADRFLIHRQVKPKKDNKEAA